MKKSKRSWYKFTFAPKKSFMILALVIAAVSFTIITIVVEKNSTDKIMSDVMQSGTSTTKADSSVQMQNQMQPQEYKEPNEYQQPSDTQDPNQYQQFQNGDNQFGPMVPNQMNQKEPQNWNQNNYNENSNNNSPTEDMQNWNTQENGYNNNTNGGGYGRQSDQGEQNQDQNQGQYGQENQWVPSEKDCQNDVRDAKRMENELNQFIKYATKNKTDTSSLSQSLLLVQQAKEKLQSCTSMTGEELQSTRETLMGETGVQKELDVLRCNNEYDRIKKDQARTKKDFEMSKDHLEKTKKIVAKDMAQKIDEQLQRIEKMQQIKDKRLKLMDETSCKLWSGGDYFDQQMEWEDLNTEDQDLSYEMDNFWSEFESVQETAMSSEMFDNIEKEVQNTYEKEYPTMPKELQAKFDMLASTVKELITKGRECQKSNDTECIKEIQKRLDELAQKGAELFQAPEVDFKKYGFDNTVNKNFQTVTQDMNYGEANEIINYLLSLDPTLAAKITDPAMSNKIFKIIGRIPENMKNQYMDDVGILKETFDQAAQAAPELSNYKDKILGYNYFGDGLNNLIIELKDLRDGKITVSELVANLETFRNTSKKAEVNMGVTKFADATTDTWFYDAANKEEFNLNGKNVNGKQIFDASGTTTFAEMLKVLNESAGLKQIEGDAAYAKANSHWAKGYYKAVEGKNVTLMDPDHQITRGEMARLLTEIFNIPVSTVPTKFSDLNGNPYESYISTLYSYGIMTGDGGSDKVRPNDTINRAEAFTLAKNALDKLQYATINTAEMNSYTNDLDTMK
ncbi:MAG: S-layer homology domain-containing protein [Candidatus Gracilibacteria bacterium]|jgi:hypothetical protein